MCLVCSPSASGVKHSSARKLGAKTGSTHLTIRLSTLRLAPAPLPAILRLCHTLPRYLFVFLCTHARCQIEPRGAAHRVLQLLPGGWTGGGRQVDASSGDGGDGSPTKPIHSPTLPRTEEQKKVPVTHISVNTRILRTLVLQSADKNVPTGEKHPRDTSSSLKRETAAIRTKHGV